MDRVKSVLCKIVLFLFALLLAVGIGLGTLFNLTHRSYVAALLAAVVLAGGFWLFRKQRKTLRDRLNAVPVGREAVFVTVLCFMINGLWVLLFHPVQAADYVTFFNTAADLADGVPLRGEDYVAMFPHILGYAAFLGLFFRIFGESILAAAVLNVILTTVSCLLIFFLALRWKDRAAAVTVSLIWALCPSKMLYNTMSLSEPYYTCLLLFFFVLVSEMEVPYNEERKTAPWKAAAFGLTAGIAAGLVNTARPIGVIPLIALVLWLLFLAEGRAVHTSWKTWVLFGVLLAAAYAGVGHLWQNYETRVLGQLPPSVPGYSIYVGFNPETQGTYSDEDMDLLQSRYFGEYNRNAEDAQQSMLHSAMERIQEGRADLPALMLHKLGVLLGHDEGGAFYSKESLHDKAYSLLCMISNVWYYTVCLLAAAACICMGKSRERRSVMILPLVGVGLILAQLLVEVAARYHYALVPILILMTAFSPAETAEIQA